jgi:hypothetical protein
MQRVEFWSKERQESAAKVLLEMEAQAKSEQLSDEQAAEVERRPADPVPRFLSLKEVRSRFAKHGA